MIRKCIYYLIVISIFGCKNANTNQISLNKKEQLGKHLFFDTNLSYNNTKSCASCHSPSFAFTDGYRKSGTANGANTQHNAPSLINSSNLQYFGWANNKIKKLENQVARPLFNKHPIELGFGNDSLKIINNLNKNVSYKKLFSEVFGTKKISSNLIIESITAYVNRLESSNSAFDKNDLTPSAKRGYELFKSAKLNCIKCHALPNFTTNSNTIQSDSLFFNIGLYNVKNQNKYPLTDPGLALYTNRDGDNGKFRVPSLRNVMVTAPYMHDGSVESIDEVLAIYENGGRLILKGPNWGDGKTNKNKHGLIKGFELNKKDRIDLINFFHSLTDSTIFTNPIFQNNFNVL
jgi:cytochrome c peroxidase